MGVGGGLFLVAVGAVLTWGVNATVNGIDIQTIGVILMIVGIVGVALDLIIFMPRRRRTRVVSSGPGYGAPVGGSTVIQDQDTYV
ncbi:MAG TPA: DUF6458 family protein [Mycobacteriales bacterium]|nr:DUF6458 family protein [Mycobacteriales bacterium]HWA68001.1 DUF6458 family protein [Mycobacteriales bacterium]